MKTSVVLAALIALSSASYAAAPDYVTKAVADTSRPDEDRKADALRDPADTLAFAGVKPGMVVGELYPCGGYFSRLLSDVVGPAGKVYGLETTVWKDCAPADAKIAAVDKNFTVDAEGFGEFKVPEKFDLFWITQNYHDLHILKYGKVDMAAFNAHVFAALKPGGTYFIVDHQANPGTTEDQIAVLHRIEKAQLIREVEAAGFKLAGEGTFLHHTGDDHSKPIFDPAIRGQTDQYALKFIKP
jgi:predicted methyltransferase